MSFHDKQQNSFSGGFVKLENCISKQLLMSGDFFESNLWLSLQNYVYDIVLERIKLDCGQVMSLCFAIGQSATDDAALERFRKRMRRNLRSPIITIYLFLISTT